MNLPILPIHNDQATEEENRAWLPNLSLFDLPLHL